jgi:hypothetical protein
MQRTLKAPSRSVRPSVVVPGRVWVEVEDDGRGGECGLVGTVVGVTLEATRQ